LNIVVENSRPRRVRPLRLRIHSALRWLHIYTSMVSLVAVLFFALTGVTLNHPDWLATESTKQATGQMPADWKSGAAVDWLVVAEHLRSTQGVHGPVADRNADGAEASITFKAPGYSAECLIDTTTGKYRLTVDYQGALGVLNDLHRGRDAGGGWSSLIDVAGWFLALVSVTGLGLLVYLRKVRASALLTMAFGAVALVLASLVAA
jgi:hypothetical protein